MDAGIRWCSAAVCPAGGSAAEPANASAIAVGDLMAHVVIGRIAGLGTAADSIPDVTGFIMGLIGRTVSRRAGDETAR